MAHFSWPINSLRIRGLLLKFYCMSLCLLTWPRGYKTFFMLNSTELELLTAHKKLKYRQLNRCLASSLTDGVFIMLINVKMPEIDGILKLMSRIKFVLS